MPNSSNPSTHKFMSLMLIVILASSSTSAPVPAQNINDVQPQPPSAASRVAAQVNPAVIELNAEPLDVRSARARAMRSNASKLYGKRLHLVKFRGAIAPEWIEDLRASGFEIINYIPNNAYLVYGETAGVRRMRESLSRIENNPLEWDGEYLPEFRIQPGVFRRDASSGRATLNAERFTVQLYRDDEANAVTLNLLESYKRAEMLDRSEISHFINITVALDEIGIGELASRPDVISIHPFVEPKKTDERQSRILTGAISGNGIVAGNHLDYLAGKGFTQAQFTTSNFSVNVVDEGIDAGASSTIGTPNPTTHFALFREGNPALNSRIVFIRPYGSATVNDTRGCLGHGNINAHIIGGFVPSASGFNAFPHVDTDGYRYGLGIAPFVKIGSSTIFTLGGTFANPNISNLEAEAYRDGSRISSNGWGAGSNTYNDRAQLYDFLVRDAQPATSSVSTAGNQGQVIVFSNGNGGPAGGSTNSPGTAKNVITVGASENVRAFGGADSCGIGDTGADSINDIASFSSRGPTSDGRRKPEIVAPGTHLTGGVYQASAATSPVSGNGAANTCFNGENVCGGVPSSIFFPTGQQWYTASSGASHATPAVAGGAALVRQRFINAGFGAPSPAMTKAVMMNGARYLTGAGANDNLWSNAQGMGLLDLNRTFDTIGASNILRDQQAADLFTASNQLRAVSGKIVDGSKPFRITLAWTDAPGSTIGNAYVNNLDLELVVNGQSYLGNNFTLGNSTTGGTADARNNAESIFIPANTFPSGTNFNLQIKATNIAGDGVPNNNTALDQDYALVVANASETAAPFVVQDGVVGYVAESYTPQNGAPDPGENLTVSLALKNVGSVDTSAIVTLQQTGGIANPSQPQTYSPLIGGGASQTRNFTFNVLSNATCGGNITLSFLVQYNGESQTVTKTYAIGTQQVSFTQNFDGVSPPTLPAGWTTTLSGSGMGWYTTTNTPSSTPNAAFAGNPSTAGLSELESPAINISNANTRLEFNFNYNTELGFDGAVLEIKIGAGSYQDILAAGGSFIQNGYTRTFGNATSNPLAGRMAWSGNSGGYLPVAVQLPAAANNQLVRFRWRMGTDGSTGGAGVWLDDVRVSGAYNCVQPPTALVAPAADTWVQGADAFRNTNYGTSTEMQVKRTLNPGAGRGRRGFLRFDTSGVTGAISSAKLAVFARLSDPSLAPTVMIVQKVTDTTWGETAMTWNNQPPTFSPTALSQIIVAGVSGQYYEFDLTAFLQQERAAGRNVISLRLINQQPTGNSGAFYTVVNSREAASNRPQLFIQQ